MWHLYYADFLGKSNEYLLKIASPQCWSSTGIPTTALNPIVVGLVIAMIRDCMINEAKLERGREITDEDERQKKLSSIV
jgi:hypothetical protein